MEPARVFYSWSSDNDERVCRHLIRDALKGACEQLTVDLEESERSVVLTVYSRSVLAHLKLVLYSAFSACGK